MESYIIGTRALPHRFTQKDQTFTSRYTTKTWAKPLTFLAKPYLYIGGYNSPKALPKRAKQTSPASGVCISLVSGQPCDRVGMLARVCTRHVLYALSIQRRAASKADRISKRTQPLADRPRQFDANDDVRRVKDASDIVRIIGEHVALKPKGREYVGLCPFHADSKPSMSVVPGKQIFHCFACGTGGDVLGFVQKYLRMEFREALDYLAERAGITLTPLRSQRNQGFDSGGGAGSGNQSLDSASQPYSSRADLLKACSTADSFFKTILRNVEHGQAARDVLRARGVSDAMIEQFHIGSSPDRWDGLVRTITSKGLDPRPFIDAGLLKRRDDGGSYDALRHRIIFPIMDAAGRVIAFGGRRIRNEDDPKYLNSPETRLFSKSATMYALAQASRTIQTKQTTIITEGYMDAIACHQGGFANAVATLGTSLTREHATILRRLCHTVVLLFDSDNAGQRAADRAAEIFFNETIDVKIATLATQTDAKDPDELLKRADGAEVFGRVLAGATDLLEYRFTRLRDRLKGQGGAALARAIDEELARLVELGLARVAPIRHRLIIKRIAQVSGLDESTILKAVPVGRGSTTSFGGVGNTISSATRSQFSDRAEFGGPSEADEAAHAQAMAEVARLGSRPLDTREHLLGCILCEGDLYSTLDVASRMLVAANAFSMPSLRAVAHAVAEIAEREEGPTTPTLSNVLDALAHDQDGVEHNLDQDSPMPLLGEYSEEIEWHSDPGYLAPVAREAAVALASRVHTLTRGEKEALHANWRSTLARAMIERDERAMDTLTKKRGTDLPDTEPKSPASTKASTSTSAITSSLNSTARPAGPPLDAGLVALIELKRKQEERRKSGEIDADRRVLPKPR